MALAPVLPVAPVIPRAVSLTRVRLACAAARPDFGVKRERARGGEVAARDLLGVVGEVREVLVLRLRRLGLGDDLLRGLGGLVVLIPAGGWLPKTVATASARCWSGLAGASAM